MRKTVERCFECSEKGHKATTCKERARRYTKLGMKVTESMKPLECIECSSRNLLIIGCAHVMCESCNDKTSVFGCCYYCVSDYSNVSYSKDVAKHTLM